MNDLKKRVQPNPYQAGTSKNINIFIILTYLKIKYIIHLSVVLPLYTYSHDNQNKTCCEFMRNVNNQNDMLSRTYH